MTYRVAPLLTILIIMMILLVTSTGLYRSCAALACFLGTFELNVEEVWFGLDRQFEQTDKINVFWFAFLEFGLVCLIEIGLILFGYTTEKKQI